MRSARALVVMAVLALLPGCSSVPEVVFADADAAVGDAAVDPAATVDAARPRDAGASYSCPGRPPPASAGVCCGSRLCVKCSAAQCDRCDKQRCTSPNECCAKNTSTSGNSVGCEPAATCN